MNKPYGSLGAQPRLSAEPARPVLVDVLPLIASTIAIVVLVLMARGAGAGTTPALSAPAMAVIVLGGVVNTLLLAWFRSGEIKRNSNRSYVTPSWNPPRVAAGMVLLGWAACLLASFWIGLSWSRR